MTSTNDTAGQPATAPDPQEEVVGICRDLIRIDSTNRGDGSGPGERAAAEYVMGQLTDVGLDPTYRESATGRANVTVRVEGSNRARSALVLHGHLDVVPANAADWQEDPFGAQERDGCIWGRGAVDMKDMDAMMIANLRHLVRSGSKAPRDIVFAFFADEEAGGDYGSHWMVEQHPEVFEGADEAISEVGGFSVTVPRRGADPVRAYLLQTAEKGIAWLTLNATGVAGHGSVPNDQNAIVRLAQAIERINAHHWPRQYIVSVRALLDGIGELSGVPADDEHHDELLAQLPSARGFVEGSLRDTANVTMLQAGYKHNVVPQSASAALDTRFLPGHEEDLMATLRELAGEHVEVVVDHRDIALESPVEGALVDAMRDALLKEDPEATVLPYCLSGGTDNKALSLLGITGYGFAPLRLPADLPFAPMFHGIDERVPVDSLLFGTRVLQRLIQTC